MQGTVYENPSDDSEGFEKMLDKIIEEYGW